MKKILSFVLVLAMIASMMCIGVSAETSFGTKDIVVGGTVDGNRVGADSFTSETIPAGEVKATVDGDVKNKYSVDLTYSVSNIAIKGNVTWNPDTLKYDTTGLDLYVGTTPDPVAKAVKTSATLTVGSCSVTNYSDLPVWVGASVVTSSDNVTSDFDLDGATTPTDLLDGTKVEVASAYDGDDKGSEKTVSFTVSLSSNDWANVASDLKNQNATAQNGVVVATYTIVISDTNA